MSNDHRNFPVRLSYRVDMYSWNKRMKVVEATAKLNLKLYFNLIDNQPHPLSYLDYLGFFHYKLPSIRPKLQRSITFVHNLSIIYLN